MTRISALSGLVLAALLAFAAAPATAQVSVTAVGQPACTAFGTTSGTCIQGAGAGGTPSSIVLTNASGTAAALNIGGNAATATSATSATSATTATTATNLAGGGAGVLARQTGAGATGFTTATFPTTAGTSGNILTSDGTNWSSAAPAAAAFSTNQFAVRNAADQAITSATPVDITWGTEDLDPGSAFTANTWTVPATGTYRSGYLLILDNTTLTSVTVELRVNGVNIEQWPNTGTAVATARFDLSATRTFNLTAADTVTLRLTAVGSGISLRGVATLNSTWWAERVY